jgi:hypothetical protein
MRALFSELPEACDNTLLVAEQCEVEFTEGADLMPRFPLPPGRTRPPGSSRRSSAGLHKRWPGGIPDHVRKQADYEVGIITQMGFPGYFLVVADFINWAKDNGIRVGPGRGSAAGSLAAYAMGITDLDPLAHGLIFERFLNPERVSMPDVDIDFDDRRRGEVIQYVSEKYGEERVSQIVTYGTIKAKAAIKDAARVLDRPYSVGDELTKLMPPASWARTSRCRGSSTRPTRATRRPRSSAPATSPTRRGRGRRPGAQARGAEAPVGRARGRRHHRALPADRQRPDHAARGRRRGHHAVRLPDLRDARPAEDGLPGPAQPHRHRRRAAQHRRERQGADRPRRDQQGPHRPGHLRAARPR